MMFELLGLELEKFLIDPLKGYLGAYALKKYNKKEIITGSAHTLRKFLLM